MKADWEDLATLSFLMRRIDEAKERQKWQKYLELMSDREAVKAFIQERLQGIVYKGDIREMLKVQDEWIDHCLKQAEIKIDPATPAQDAL